MKILPVTSLFSSSAHSIHSSLPLSICHDPRTHSLSGLSATGSEVGEPSGGSGGMVGLGEAHPLTTSRDNAKSVPALLFVILGTVLARLSGAAAGRRTRHPRGYPTAWCLYPMP